MSVWSAFLMPFLPLFTGIRHLPYVLLVPPTKVCLLCTILYTQVHARRLLPSAVPWISEDRLFRRSRILPMPFLLIQQEQLTSAHVLFWLPAVTRPPPPPQPFFLLSLSSCMVWESHFMWQWAGEKKDSYRSAFTRYSKVSRRKERQVLEHTDIQRYSWEKTDKYRSIHSHDIHRYPWEKTDKCSTLIW